MKATSLSVSEGHDLRGKTALVTGASSGLGLECARVLALRGARVLFACRNREKTERVIASLEDLAPRCHFRECDLASMRSVNALVDRLAGEHEAIDLVFLNAGVFASPFAITDEGFEITYASNYVGHFLLTHRLVDERLLTSDARIVATLSEGVYVNPLSSADVEMAVSPTAKRYSSLTASPNTKVLLALFAQEFSRRISTTPLPRVTFNGAFPGATLTDNVNQSGAVGRALGKLFAPILFDPPEVGAASLLHVALDASLAGETGKSFSSKLREKKLPRKATDDSKAREAWDRTEARLSLTPWRV
jgi:NAD(P)-dependent dehydrogenase (short-subunit alcohol dehydrogenase family)